MSASSEKSQTLNLKLGSNVFPVKKTDLETFSLFQKNPSLLDSDEYEVQSQVPLPVLSSLVYTLEGGPITFCEATFNFYQPLADEFGLEKFFDSQVKSPRPGRRSVTLTVKKCSTRYEVLRAVWEIQHFAKSLMKVDEGGIAINGREVSNHPMENAIAAVYCNTKASLPNTRPKAPFLALILWIIGQEASKYTIDTVTYCLDLLQMLAPTGFDTARLLLLSQCDPSRPDDFVLLETADWSVVREAVVMLEAQKHRKAKEAKALLKQLQENEQYRPMNWNTEDLVGITDPDASAD
jgi:hypothetical protein